jgi:hypothetical protein
MRGSSSYYDLAATRDGLGAMAQVLLDREAQEVRVVLRRESEEERLEEEERLFELDPDL